MTPKRLELLHTIKTDSPKSINELARITKRDIKNVADDIKYLEQIGFIEKRVGEKGMQPSITYDKISLEIAI